MRTHPSSPKSTHHLHQPPSKPDSFYLTMASHNKLSAAIFILSLVFSTTLSSANGTCTGPSPPKKPSPPANPPPMASCPKDALKLAVCADVLGLVNVQLGPLPTGSKCCALIKGLADLEAAVCLCTALKANVLGNNLNIPIALSVLVSACSKIIPPGFKCA